MATRLVWLIKLSDMGASYIQSTAHTEGAIGSLNLDVAFAL